MEESRLDTTHTAEMIEAITKMVGREVKVYVSPAAIPDTASGSSRASEEDLPDDFFEFTAADYAAIQATKKEEVYLKTRKIREQELAARRAQRTKQATIRVHFPDGFVVEATFKSTETMTDLMEVVRKVIGRPDLPFYLYTTPPKKLIKNLQENMMDASFTPGANVHFSFQPSQAHLVPREGPYLRPEVQELRDLHILLKPVDNGGNAAQADSRDTVTAPEAPAKRTTGAKSRPKWMRM